MDQELSYPRPQLRREGWTDLAGLWDSHPCIVAWVPLNESWGVPNLPRDQAQRHYVRALYHLTMALDRPAQSSAMTAGALRAVDQRPSSPSRATS